MSMANMSGNSNVIVVERHYIPINLYTDIYNPGRLYNNTSSYTTEPRLHNIQSLNTQTTNTQTTNTHYTNTQPTNTQPTNTQPTNTQPTNTLPRTRGVFSFFTNPSIINSRFTIPNPTNASNLNNPTNATNTSDTNALEEAFMNYFNVLLGADRTTTNANSGLNNIQIINSTHVTTFTNEQPDDDNATNSDNGENSNHSNHSNSCAICVAPYNEGDILLTINTCNHNFHQNCIQTWLGTHNSCPLCRSNVYVPLPNTPTNTINTPTTTNTINTPTTTNTPTYTRLFNYYYPYRNNASDTVNNDIPDTSNTDEYYANSRDIDAMD